ncbi:MAG: hypothetical protein RLZZ393_1307, partial [Pseudomonadota bacterium]
IAAGAVATLPLLGSQAFAADDGLEEVIVTGSSIKGAAPVGSNVISVGRDQLAEIGAQTVQQVLKTVPAVVGLQSAGQGGYGSFDGAGTNAPTIHGLGASASNSTLVLINGHRLPLSGLNHTLADPNILAPSALERVEVLTDGASSVYGSDAVAGVVNFITRRKYEGVEANAQAGFGDGYRTYNAGFVAGKRWDGGSGLLSYSYSDRSRLSPSDRPFTTAASRVAHGMAAASQFSYSCGVANAKVGSTTYSGVTGAALTAPNCDYSGYTDLLPAEQRHNVFLSFEQAFGDRTTVTGDFIYSLRQNNQNVARGSVSATIFGAGYTPANGNTSVQQINPFFALPSGAAAGTTSETVYWQADDLLGRGAHIDSAAETAYASLKADYKLSAEWTATVGTILGRDNARQQNVGQLCVSCAYLALNGTTNGTGNITTPSIVGTSTAVLGLPLTAANALDVFHPGSSNLTSADVKARLVDSLQTAVGRQTLTNFYANLNGSLFALPGGDARAALGAEYLSYTLDQDITRPTNTGPSSIASSHLNLNYDRTVRSAFAEVLLPFVGPEQGITGIRKLEFNVSGRIDKYSDFGDTKNPKFAANWEVVQGFKFRGNYAKSFVAPALTSRGVNAYGLTGESSYGNYGLGQINVPLATYANANTIPGVSCTATACALGTSTITGMQINGGNGGLKPQTGTSWGLGFDWTPAFVDGLRLSATYWSNELRGGITAPVPALAINSTALNSLLTILPSPAQIAAAKQGLPQGSALPANVYFIYNYQQRNVLNLNVTGLDVEARYTVNTDAGRFNAGLGFTKKLKFDQQVGTGGQWFSVLGTAGFNTTFPSLKLEGRANLGWQKGAVDANLYVNYTGSYRNWSGSAITGVNKVNGVPTTGGDPVAANTTVDLNIGYKLAGRLEGTSLFVDATNLFDRDPPFFASGTGFDGTNANALGRVITVGVRTKF